MKKGLLFGSFDHFHLGHQWVLNQAKKMCDHLTVIVALDESIQRRKHRTPTHALDQRIKAVKESALADEAYPGDAQEGDWSIFQHNPIDVVFVGYDQHELLAALKQIQPVYSFQIVQLESYHPDRYKSSLYV